MTKTKNRKESILKNAKSIPKLIHTIADVGTKSANRGSTKGKAFNEIPFMIGSGLT